MEAHERRPAEGRLFYRGIDIRDLIEGCTAEDRFGFEEVVWLLLFGYLPTAEQLSGFTRLLEQHRELPEGFIEDMIIKAPSPNIMNSWPAACWRCTATTSWRRICRWKTSSGSPLN